MAIFNVATAATEVLRALGHGSFERQPIDKLIHDLTTHQQSYAQDDIDLDRHLSFALTKASPDATSLAKEVARMTTLLQQVVSGRPLSDEEDRFLRTALLGWSSQKGLALI